MLQDVHERKISIPVAATATGDNVVIAAVPGAWIYVHELMGDLDNTGNLIIKAGSRTLGSFTLDQGQGFTTQDEPGEDGRPRYECKPGEDFILTISAGAAFRGQVHYSLRY